MWNVPDRRKVNRGTVSGVKETKIVVVNEGSHSVQRPFAERTDIVDSSRRGYFAIIVGLDYYPFLTFIIQHYFLVILLSPRH
jgi:hypothetical protein